MPLAVDTGHVGLVVALADGRREVVEPVDLIRAQFDAVGGYVLLDAGDSPGAGDRGDVAALGEQPARAICAGVAPASAAMACTSSTTRRSVPSLVSEPSIAARTLAGLLSITRPWRPE